MKSRIVQIGLALCSLVLSVSVSAAAQRTFVASSGNDMNSCSLVLPCRSFAIAILQTISGGEVIVLDSAGYGPVTIFQSVSITAPSGVYAGISVPVSGTNTGVLINGAGITVVLRGLTINSVGGTTGIRLTSGAKLMVEDCFVSDFGAGIGVSIETAAFVDIVGTVIRGSRYGVIVGYGATTSIAKSQVIDNFYEGIEINGGGFGEVTNVLVSDTIVTGTGASGETYCVDNFASYGGAGNLSATRVIVAACQYGFNNVPQSAGMMTVGESVATGNYVGFSAVQGTFVSLGDNNVTGNHTNAAGTITTVPRM